MNAAGLAFAPLLPTPLAAAGAALALLAGLIALLRAPRSGAFRVFAALALALFLFNPQLRVAERTRLDDVVAVIIDRSASQSLDGRASATRTAEKALDEALARLEGVEIVKTRIGDDETTPLGEAVARAYADNPAARLGAVIAITDGVPTDAIGPPQPGAPPFHALISGRLGERDRRLSLVDAPRYGVVNEGVDVSFRIDDVGQDGAPLPQKGEATVVLRVDGEVVLKDKAPIGAEVSFLAPLARPGKTVVEVEVEPLDGELSPRNNIAVLEISAIRDRLRVLLVSGEPHAGERAWRNLLKSDPAIDLIHFTILRPTDKAQSDTALESELSLIEFPVDELFIERLSEFDLLIFDRYTYRGVLNAYHFDNIARYVEDGGAVLVSSGPEFFGYLSIAARRNFAFVLPALPTAEPVETPFRPQLTEAGKRHPVTADLPDQATWGRWLRVTPSQARSGDTLMSGAGEPLLILDHVGKGRIGMIQSDHVWLWARGFDGGGPHTELLRRIAHWLMKEPDLEEERLSLREEAGALVVERRTLEDAAPAVALEAPDGSARDIALAPAGSGRFAARVENAPRGLWRARSGDLFAIGAVGLAAPREYENLVSRADLLRPTASATGGGVFRIGEKGAIPDIRSTASARRRAGPGWAGIMARNAARTDAAREEPIAPPAAYLALIALGLLGAWLVEAGRLWKRD